MAAALDNDKTIGAMSVRGNACLKAESLRALAIACPVIRSSGDAGTWSGG